MVIIKMTSTSIKKRSIEERLQEVEDRIEIANIIACQPPIADSLSHDLASAMFTPDGMLDRGALGSRGIHSRDTARDAALQTAAEMGVVHMGTSPYIKLGKNSAVALTYAAVVVPDPSATELAVPLHGSGRGHRIYMIAANRWQLIRIDGSWKLKTCKIVPFDGSPEPRELARSVLDAILTD